jgi:hypothetical protein
MKTRIKWILLSIKEFWIYVYFITLSYITMGLGALFNFLITALITILVTPMAFACLAVDKIRRRRNAKCK